LNWPLTLSQTSSFQVTQTWKAFKSMKALKFFRPQFSLIDTKAQSN